MTILTDIYRSSRREGMYLYVRKGYDISQLPEPLRVQFGRAELAMSLLLNAEKKLARVKASAVIEQIEAQGFFLQMPPSGALDAYMQQIPNHKL